MKNSYIPRDRERDAQPLSTIACQQLTVKALLDGRVRLDESQVRLAESKCW